MVMTDTARRGRPEYPALKHIFEEYEEESVTDEQVEWILAPALALIASGAFDRPKTNGAWRRWRQKRAAVRCAATAPLRAFLPPCPASVSPGLSLGRLCLQSRPKPSRFAGALRLFAAAAAVLALVLAGVPWGRGAQAPPRAVGGGPAVMQDESVPLAAPPAANTLSGRLLFPGGEASAVVLLLIDENTQKTVAKTQAAPDGSYLFGGFPDGTYRIEAIPPEGGAHAAAAASGGLTFGQGTRTRGGVDITV